MLIGGVNFADIKVTIKEAATAADGSILPAVTLNLGNFIQTMVDFTIIAFAIFLLIKALNSMKRKEEEKPAPAAPPAPTNEEKLLAEIRDLLKKH